MTWDATRILGLAIAIVVGFGLGYLTARLVDHVRCNTTAPSRATEENMTKNERPLGMQWLGRRPRLYAAYVRAVPVLVAICLLASLFSSTGVFWLNVKHGEDQRTRTADNAAFIVCLDKYTTALAGSLPPVRAATAKRDAALSRALLGTDGLKGVINRIRTRTATLDDFTKFAETLDRLQDANAALTKARAENPYPPPPSTLCNLP